MSSRGRAIRVPALVMLGCFLVQLAWIFAVPPFRGLDEHDHAFRADSVAHGYWLPTHQAVPGARGDRLAVRPGIAAAAEPICAAFKYEAYNDCHPQGDAGHGLVWMSSGSATYNPVYYFVVGTPGLLFDGVHALYAMRVLSSLLCSAIIGLAVAVALREPRLRQTGPLSALVVFTPMLSYSNAVVAPNGIELSAALLSWLGLMSVRSAMLDGRAVSRFAMGSTASGVVILAVVRSLGPLWLVLVAGAVLLALPRRPLQRRWSPWLTLGAIGAVAALAGGLWSVSQGTNTPHEPGHAMTAPMMPDILVQPILWVLQSIGAFPARDEPAPTLTYAFGVSLLLAVVIIGFRVATTRRRWVLVLVTLLSFAIPMALTVMTYSSIGLAWQGRYSMPFSMGVIILCVTAARRVRHWVPTVWVVSALSAGATAISVWSVGSRQLIDSPLAHSSEWFKVPVPVLAALVVVGWVIMGLAVARVPVESRLPERHVEESLVEEGR